MSLRKEVFALLQKFNTEQFCNTPMGQPVASAFIQGKSVFDVTLFGVDRTTHQACQGSELRFIEAVKKEMSDECQSKKLMTKHAWQAHTRTAGERVVPVNDPPTKKCAMPIAPATTGFSRLLRDGNRMTNQIGNKMGHELAQEILSSPGVLGVAADLMHVTHTGCGATKFNHCWSDDG